jgi:hypothetical protein
MEEGADMIEWLNANTGAIMAALTAVYVVCTVVLCVVAWRSNEISRRLYEESIRPFLVPNFPVNRGVVLFTLQNIGKRPATNVSIVLETEVPTLNGKPLNDHPFLKAIKSVQPGPPLDILVNTGPQLAQVLSDAPVIVKLRYSDMRGQQYDEKHVLDLKGLLHRTSLRPDTVEDKLEKIAQQLERISSAAP